jgi:hypothetical protein
MVSAPWRDTHHPHLQAVLIVERFDRAWMDGGPWIARLPQEDFCQALGHSPNQKYEKEGRPGMDACLRLLDGSADAEVDRLSAHAAGVLADGGQRRARQELLALHRAGRRLCDDAALRRHLPGARFNADLIELKGN